MIEEVTPEDQLGWSIQVSRELLLVELAALIAGIGARVTVEFVWRGAVIRPIDIGTPKPTPEQIRDILEHGVEHLPKLRVVGSMRR